MQSPKCEISIYEDEPIYALKNMSKNKSPSNDGLTEKIYETFWDESETSFLNHFLKRS